MYSEYTSQAAAYKQSLSADFDEYATLLKKSDRFLSQYAELLGRSQRAIEGEAGGASSVSGGTTAVQSDAHYQGKEFYDKINGGEQNREIPDSAFDSVPDVRRNAVKDAFGHAPDDIKGVVMDYGDNLNVESTDGNDCCHFNPKDKTIRMEASMDDSEYTEVFTHEYGHFADDQMGLPSESAEFVSAVLSDKSLYDRETTEGRERFDRMMNDAFSSGAVYDRMVSDNMSALFQNDPEVIIRFRNEGIPYYQHSNEYWNRGLNRENEIFANIFSIQTNGDLDSLGFMNNYMPNTTVVFDHIIQSRRGS
jgi:hypothetical protein